MSVYTEDSPARVYDHLTYCVYSMSGEVSNAGRLVLKKTVFSAQASRL